MIYLPLSLSFQKDLLSSVRDEYREYCYFLGIVQYTNVCGICRVVYDISYFRLLAYGKTSEILRVVR